jgi:hypothetical protein
MSIKMLRILLARPIWPGPSKENLWKYFYPPVGKCIWRNSPASMKLSLFAPFPSIDGKIDWVLTVWIFCKDYEMSATGRNII